MKREFKKLGITYIPYKGASCIQHPHYDLYEDDGKGEGTGYAVACILASDKESVKLIRQWIKQHNKNMETK